MDVSQLSDAELRDNLRTFGVNVGPIVASTRKVYEKKLLKLSSNTNNDTINDSATESPAVTREFSPIFANMSPAPGSPSPAPAAAPEESDSEECEESMRFLTEEEMAADRAAAAAARRALQKPRGNGGCPIVAWLLLAALVAVFAFFLFENAEQLKLLTEPNADDVV